MGLVGRLADLPITDIVQIVYLSRGTGILELRLEQGRHTVMFSVGLMVNASSPIIPSLRLDLERRLNAGPLSRLLPDESIPVGVAALQRNLVSPADLGKMVFERVATVVRGLNEARNGEFEFVARKPSLEEMEYDPLAVFRNGGIRPEHVFGKKPTGLRTLREVKQTIKDANQRVTAEVKLPARPALAVGDRCLFLIEEHAATREAIRTAAKKRGISTIEATSQEADQVVTPLLGRERSLVAVLSITAGDPQTVLFPLIGKIKRHNSHHAVVVIDETSDFRRRHLAFAAGADLYMRKPAGEADEERIAFTDDLLLFVDRRFAEQKSVTAPNPGGEGYRLLVQLIKEVSDHSDLTQITLTVLQSAADYIDRGVLFGIKENHFATLGKFGVGSSAPGLRLRRGELPLLDGVVTTGTAFSGVVDAETASQLAGAFGGASIREVVVLPLKRGDEVVGVLYGDNAVNHRPLEDTLGLEVFLSQAGFAFRDILQSNHPLSGKTSSSELQLA